MQTNLMLEMICFIGSRTGGASVGFQMANEESRKYFNRAYILSGSLFNYFALTEEGHLERMLECSQTKDQTSLIDYLKTTDAEKLLECYFVTDWGKTIKPKWAPTIEKPNAKMPFITQSLDKTYENTPALDVVFSFTDQVI